MRFKVKIILLVFVILQSYSFADTNYVKLTLDKKEFIQGDSINLIIESDFNKGDSVVIFCPYGFLFGITLTNEQGQIYRNISLYISKIGRLICPQDSIHPNEVKKIKTNLNCDYTTEDKYKTYDVRCLEDLPIGTYSVNWGDFYYHFYLDKYARANKLTFKILPKN